MQKEKVVISFVLLSYLLNITQYLNKLTLIKIKYYNPKIQNELIQLISNKVENELISNIKAVPFFSIIIDTTQDISKVDQLSEIYRYCIIEKDQNGEPKNICIKETFLGFYKVV